MVLKAKICYAITVIIRVVLKIEAKEVMLSTGFYTLRIWVATYQLMRQAYRMESFIRF